ncbi:MAG TPA: hypothetical protein PK425_01080 [Syntrophales bacterium]|jgi:predicted nucleotidyltransferase|nr:hypothetical protein [Syntrophales bacterium]HQA82245.1 hypothetical protein [Syntrophales bacterium]
MAKIPKKPEEIFPEMTERLKSAFGDDLKSVVLYGSGASGEYLPGKSDLNFLVIVTDGGMKKLSRLHPYMKDWGKKRVAVPLVMTKSFLHNALDVYPIEFMTMKTHHIRVTGDDILSSLVFDGTCMRLQLEREIKGKLLHLRQGYLASQGEAKQLQGLIKASLVAFLSLFEAVLFLKGVPAPSSRRRLIRDTCAESGLDEGVFLRCLDIKEDAMKYDLKETTGLFGQYLSEIEKFDCLVDQLKQEINRP